MIIIILGPSGCGKGTQADRLAEKYHLTHISTGDLLRRAYADKTQLGIEAHRHWRLGHWAPTSTVGPLLASELEKYPDGNFILEGWPRMPEQTGVFEDYLKSHKLKIDRVIYLDTPKDLCRERIRQRTAKAQKLGFNPRPDDQPEIVEERLESYDRTIQPILDYYRNRDLISVVDNRGSADEVFGSLVKIIDDKN